MCVGGWACACAGGVRFSNSNRIIPSDYRILLLLKMPIPIMNKHSYLSTRLVDLNNIKMYTVDKQYKNRRHIGLNA